MMAWIVAKRLVEHLERSGFVVIKRPAPGSRKLSGNRYIQGIVAYSRRGTA